MGVVLIIKTNIVNSVHKLHDKLVTKNSGKVLDITFYLLRTCQCKYYNVQIEKALE